MKDGFIYEKVLMKAMRRMEETGVSQKIWRQHFPPPLKTQEDEGEAEPFTMEPLQLSFYFWLSGLFLAVVAFVVELYMGGVITTE